MRLSLILVIAPFLAACADERIDLGEPAPPAVVVEPLCLEAVPFQLEFDSPEPGVQIEQRVALSPCEPTAWSAAIDLDGSAFVGVARVVDAEGQPVEVGGTRFDLEPGHKVVVGVSYLARSGDDGAEGRVHLRGVAGERVGRAEVTLIGSVALTCAECGCCNDEPLPATEYDISPAPGGPQHQDGQTNCGPSNCRTDSGKF